jgi:hypothetical protein
VGVDFERIGRAMKREKDSNGVSVEVSADGLKLAASDNTLDKVGSGLAMFFSKRAARARIDHAMATRIAQKFENGDYNLEPAEQFFFASVYKKEIRQFENQQRILDRAQELLPEAKLLLPMSSEASEAKSTSDDWVERFLESATRVSDAEMVELFARIAAGEFTRPGSFSMKTLSVVLDMDADTIAKWRSLRPLVFDKQFLIPYDEIPTFYSSRSLSYDTFVHLESCGLVKLDKNCFRNAASWSHTEGTTNVIGYCDRTIYYYSEEVAHLYFDAWGVTPVGQQLLAMTAASHDEEFFQKLLDYIGTAQPDNLITDPKKVRHHIQWSDDGRHSYKVR